MAIAIVDYGASNLLSVYDAFDRLGEDSEIVSTPEQILAADRLILPGVGAAGMALIALRERGLDQALHESVRVRATPFLGICLGMQLLAERLFEFGEHEGLGWFPGQVVPLRQIVDDAAHVPHMGWNSVEYGAAAGTFFDGFYATPEFYFAHSYAVQTDALELIAATSDHYGRFATAVQFDTVFATQFHPEKSQMAGERLLDNFLQWCP